MTIDEAIKHCLEVAEGLEKKANTYGIKQAYIPKSREAVDCISCAADHRQLAEWLTNYKEAIRLLKAAVEDMHIEDMCDVCVKRIPNSPIHCPDSSNCFVWRYKDEALKLIQNS